MFYLRIRVKPKAIGGNPLDLNNNSDRVRTAVIEALIHTMGADKLLPENIDTETSSSLRGDLMRHHATVQIFTSDPRWADNEKGVAKFTARIIEKIPALGDGNLGVWVFLGEYYPS